MVLSSIGWDIPVLCVIGKAAHGLVSWLNLFLVSVTALLVELAVEVLCHLCASVGERVTTNLQQPVAQRSINMA